MDENQLAKISTGLRKIISLQWELWRMRSSGSRRLKFKVFFDFLLLLFYFLKKLLCKQDKQEGKNIPIELDGCDDKFGLFWRL